MFVCVRQVRNVCLLARYGNRGDFGSKGMPKRKSHAHSSPRIRHAPAPHGTRLLTSECDAILPLTTIA